MSSTPSLQIYAEHVPVATGSEKPVLSNTYGEGRNKIAYEPEQILQAIITHTGGWPKCIAGSLVVKNREGEIEVLSKENMLFAWLHSQFNVRWDKNSSGSTKGEFMEFLKQKLDKYRAYSNYPHYPKIDGLLYNHPELPQSDGSKLDQFLDFFRPASHQDRELIKAFLLTLVWGGPPGKRPGFIFTTNDSSKDQGVGHGKTATAVKCSKLLGGFVEYSNNESSEDFRRRLINDNGTHRVILRDNLKTLKLSCPSLESWMTATQISGHRLYNGNATKINLYTFVITVNGSYLSKDLSQRHVTIKVAKPHYNCNWEDEIDAFIDQHRWAIIADIVSLLESDGELLPHEGSTRWAAWERDVLAKCHNPAGLRNLIRVRMDEINDDLHTATSFYEQLLEMFLPHRESSPPQKIIYCCSHDTMAEQLSDFYGEKIGKNIVEKRIKLMPTPWLYKDKNNHGRCIWYFNRLGEPVTPELIAQSH